MIRSLDELIFENGQNKSISCIIPKNVKNYPSFQKIQFERLNNLTGNLWEQITLPIYTQRHLLFSPCNTGPFSASRQIITIHDASVYAYPGAYSRWFVYKYKILFRRFSNRAEHLITVSEFSKMELVKICKRRSR